jgi:hypothetical protein
MSDDPQQRAERAARRAAVIQMLTRRYRRALYKRRKPR